MILNAYEAEVIRQDLLSPMPREKWVARMKAVVPVLLMNRGLLHELIQKRLEHESAGLVATGLHPYAEFITLIQAVGLGFWPNDARLRLGGQADSE